MSHPLISVIVPAFAAQATIQRCLSSLAVTALPRQSVEFLVEPDDATSYDWVDSAAFPVNVARTSIVQSGPGPTRNRALRRALGEWITYVDADDHVAPGFLDQLLETATISGAALAQTRIEKGDRVILHVGQAHTNLRFADWARTGVSVRGMFHRSRFPEFVDQPAQDILHIVEATLRHGTYLPFSRAVYVLTLGPDTVTAQPDFKDQVAVAYGTSVDYLQQQFGGAPMLPEAVAFWKAKADLNRNYLNYRNLTTYYEFIALNAQEK